MAFFRFSTLAVSMLVALSLAPSALSLSWPLCDPAGLVWMTERPERDIIYPGSNLWFFCNSGINVLGDGVDICRGNGSSCNALDTANVLCQILGYDEASTYETDITTTNVLSEGQAARSLSGEFCLADGSYSLERPQGLTAPVSGGPCTVLDKLVCVRLSTSMDAAAEAAFLAITDAQAAENVVAPTAEALTEVPALQPAGRRLLAV